MIECVRFKGRERRINIPQEIGVKFHDFCLVLLEDDTGARIQSIAHKHNNDAEKINVEVLQQWMTGRGKQPVTWMTLTEVLRDMDLPVLAGEIVAVKLLPEEGVVTLILLQVILTIGHKYFLRLVRRGHKMS